MRPKDVAECVEIVATNPIVAPRYGAMLARLSEVWLRLFGCEAFLPFVFEEVRSSIVKTVAVGVTAFISDDFLIEVKTPPLFWIGRELVSRILAGHSPLLCDKEVREANSSGGLNLFLWQCCRRLQDVSEELSYEITSAFFELHRGFLLKEVIAQAENGQRARSMLNAGAFFLNPDDGRYLDLLPKSDSAIVAEPHVFGVTRELTHARIGSWVGSLFLYRPPRFGLSPSEQRLMLCALGGGTDEELSDQLCISVSAVKKAWLSIYGRVADRLPGLAPLQTHSGSWFSERGKEKKQRLIAYVREHPEELRPVSRKLLQQVAARQRPSPGRESPLRRSA